MFEKVIDQLAGRVPIDQDTYLKDGIIYCARCHTARQKRLELFGSAKVVPCICKCMNEAWEAEEAERKQQERARNIMRNRINGFPDKELRKCTFAADDGAQANISKTAKAYVDQFKYFRDEGKGLLLYGNVGTGKSFYAACIVNALIDLGYPCMMTNFTRLANQISEMWEGKQAYIDGLKKYALVALDDLGAERDTEYMKENVTTIIDSLYRARVPMIITTNYTPKQLVESDDIRRDRIYDRVLERCHPVKVDGASRRKEKGREDYRRVEKLLGRQEPVQTRHSIPDRSAGDHQEMPFMQHETMQKLRGTDESE